MNWMDAAKPKLVTVITKELRRQGEVEGATLNIDGYIFPMPASTVNIDELAQAILEDLPLDEMGW